jgi:hypothetical protein
MTGCDSDRPMTCAPGMPHRGQTMAAALVRFAMVLLTDELLEE